MNPERIGGYEILKELGRGAMGVVYHAHDAAIGRPVAIKVIRIDAGTTAMESAQLRQRLIREASTAGKIYHPGIVTVHQLGEDGENVFIVMEYVEGPSLEHMLVNNPVLGQTRTLDILRQVADALDYAHKSQVVHRDVKPGNILVRGDGRVKIADFGIAKLTNSVASGMTGTGVSFGSPAYMSPEQAQAIQIDGRSDQFALGTMAFQMLTGRMPFRGDSAHSVMYQIVMVDPFETLPSDIPVAPNVRAVLARALAKNPADRYPDCATFIQELTDAARSVAAPAPEPFAAKLDSMPPPEPPRKEDKRWMRLPIAGGVVALVLLGAAIYWYIHWTCCAPPPVPQPLSEQQPAGKTAESSDLLTAVASGNVEKVKALLAKGANAERPDAEGTTPLMLASEGSAAVPEGAPMVEALLNAGAHVDSVDGSGRSALYRASAAGKTGAMGLLLDHQANANLRATDFSTPLIEAVTHARLDAAQLLIDRGADVNLGDANNTTPLMVAADAATGIANPADFLRLLLEHGAKRGAKDSRGRIAFQIAVETKNSAAVQLLR
jgi:tRNA A-37 threonylcarbamoyl transferase component Bud32